MRSMRTPQLSKAKSGTEAIYSTDHDCSSHNNTSIIDLFVRPFVLPRHASVYVVWRVESKERTPSGKTYRALTMNGFGAIIIPQSGEGKHSLVLVSPDDIRPVQSNNNQD